MAVESLPAAAQPAVAAQAPGCLDLMSMAVNFTRVTFQTYLEKQPLLMIILAVACVIFGLSPFLPTAVNLVIFTVPLLIFTYFVVETIIQHPEEIVLSLLRDLNKKAIEDAQHQTTFRETAHDQIGALKNRHHPDPSFAAEPSAPRFDKPGLGNGYGAAGSGRYGGSAGIDSTEDDALMQRILAESLQEHLAKQNGRPAASSADGSGVRMGGLGSNGLVYRQPSLSSAS